MSVGELVGYASFPWEKLRGSVDPLDLVLAHQFRAYIKFDTSRYVARTKSWIVAALEGQRSSTNQYASIGSWRQAKALPEGLQAVWDSDISILALGDSSIAEIRATGDCTVKIFNQGGLKSVVKGDTDTALESLVSVGQMRRYENVPFAECFLVEKLRMVEHEVPKGMIVGMEPLDRQAVEVRIGREDLYFERDQLERVGWADSDYPPDDDKTRPLAIIWLYKVSVAFNTGLIRPRVVDERRKKTQGYLEIEKWLEDNAPESVAKGALKRTARTIASMGYNGSKKFDVQGLSRFAGSEHVPVENLSLPVRFALSITEWWVGLSKQRRSVPELLCVLCAVGFDKTAALDLVGMISGVPVPRDRRDGQWEQAKKVLRMRQFRKRGEGTSRRVLRKSSASDQPKR